ncbi:MAG: HAD-IB family hydrolase [Candidatus Omnitrophica bacterium]|nr:HAD-IB family hydrolase [Candidatus Omnitrophota bacterium]
MTKILAVFDVDGVLVKGTTQKFLAAYLFKNRKMSLPVFLRTSLWFLLYKVGLSRDTLVIRRVAYQTFRGWSEQDMQRIMADFFNDEIRPRISSEAVALVDEHRGKGHDVILLSASLSAIVDLIGRHVKVDQVIATRLELKDGHYTGRISGEVPYGAQKAQALREFLQASGAYGDIIVYADHISDAPLLELVGKPVAVNPDEGLRAMAREKGWMIRDLL